MSLSIAEDQGKGRTVPWMPIVAFNAHGVGRCVQATIDGISTLEVRNRHLPGRASDGGIHDNLAVHRLRPHNIPTAG